MQHARGKTDNPSINYSNNYSDKYSTSQSTRVYLLDVRRKGRHPLRTKAATSAPRDRNPLTVNAPTTAPVDISVINPSDIDITVRRAIDGSLELLLKYPLSAFSAALAFHLIDALFYILVPDDLLFRVLRPWNGMQAVTASVVASEKERVKGGKGVK